jgi:tetratricopeptide (TPR) repeat protein
MRPDFSPVSESTGLWMLSRVYSVSAMPEMALRFAQKCLETSLDPAVSPFYLGYAYEAMARALKLSGDLDLALINYTKAIDLLQNIEDSDERQYLSDDLMSLGLG